MQQSLGILFDYNGVLVGDEHLQHQAMATVVARHGVDLTDALYEQACLGRTDQAGFENLRGIFPQLTHFSTHDLIDEKAMEYQRIATHEPIMYPGVRELLEELHTEFALGVVTGALRLEVEPVLQQGGLLEFFACVITADDIQHSKPHPEGYVKGAVGLGIPKESIVVIEDTPHGIAAAKAAGMKCIAVEHTMGGEKLSQADVIVKKVIGITPELIRQLLS